MAMSELGASLERVESLMRDLEALEGAARDDVAETEAVAERGQALIASDHYAVDSIRPKCIELQRMAEQYKELVRRRRTALQQSRQLHECIERANAWCREGVDLLAEQRLTGHQNPQQAIQDLNAFQERSSALQTAQLRQLGGDLVAEDSRSLVRNVLKRVEDVHDMCEKRRQSLSVVGRQSAAAGSSGGGGGGDATCVLASPSSEPTAMRSQPAITEIEIDRRIVSPEELNSDSSSGIEVDVYTRSSPSGDSLTTKRSHVMHELINTEAVYVDELSDVIKGYLRRCDASDVAHVVPPILVRRKHEVFGNIEQIHKFHSRVFLKALQSCRETPSLVGRCFVRSRSNFQMYSQYCQNRPRSDALLRQIGPNHAFFRQCQAGLGHKLPLSAFLLKPVQRITKYQLLLKEMLKFSEGDDGAPELLEALEAMLAVLKYVNDMMHQIAISGFAGNLAEQGPLLLQGAFAVSTDHRRIREIRFKTMQRHLFLYQRLLMFCKRKDDLHSPDSPAYVFKNALKMANVGLTENVRGDKRKLEVWSHGRGEVYVMQATCVEQKQTWVRQLKQVLLQQLDALKETSKKDVLAVPLPKTVGSVLPKDGRTSRDADGSDAAWSSDDEQDSAASTQDSFHTDAGSDHFVALADYESLESGEISLKEGELVELIKIGNEGWWYVQLVDRRGAEGWAPASYLQQVPKRNSTYSTASASSTDSGHAGMAREKLRECSGSLVDATHPVADLTGRARQAPISEPGGNTSFQENVAEQTMSIREGTADDVPRRDASSSRRRRSRSKSCAREERMNRERSLVRNASVESNILKSPSHVEETLV